jgi:hypothetical protein
MRNTPPTAFLRLCDGLHQDAVTISGGTLDGLASYCLGLLSEADRESLAPYLHQLLEENSAAELKGLMKRVSPAIGFKGRAAVEFLQAIAQRL